jgi:plastocyanin
MRCGHLFGAVALGALALVSIGAGPVQACHWFRCGHGYSSGMPGYYPGQPAYQVGPGYTAPYRMPAAPGIAAPTRPTTAMTVGARDDKFDPATLNVQVGTTVQWVNNDKHPHTITSNDSKWDSGDLAWGATYSVTFKTPGTYRYHCKHHKGMEGTIIVGEPGKAPVGETPKPGK